MLDLRPVFYINGLMLVVLGSGMIVPMLVDAYFANSDWQVFLGAAMVTVFVGVSLILTNRGASARLTMRQAFLLTVSVWAVMPAFGALPIAFSELRVSYTDAYFEAMSGLTTTGATVLSGLDTAPPGLLIWRGLLLWLGAVGIIVMALGVLPSLQVAGYQLFRTESSENSEKILPRIAQISGAIATVYLGLSVLCVVSYRLAGMTMFEAFAHALATVSTGGFSTSDDSLGHFNSLSIDAVAMVFMTLSSLPFILYFRALHGQPKALIKDNQVQLFFGIIAVFSAVLTLWLCLTRDFAFLTALRYSTFNVISIMSSTGFGTVDYQTWGPFAVAVFFFLIFTGGCAGSSTGGLKMFRLWILFSMVRGQIRRLIQPHGVFTTHYNGRPVSAGALGSVVGFLFIYMASYLVFTVLLMAMGLDLITAASGAASALSNVGPGLGEVVGPVGNFQPLPDQAKWLLSLAMMMGRLELLTVLVVLTPAFWRA